MLIELDRKGEVRSHSTELERKENATSPNIRVYHSLLYLMGSAVFL